MVKRSASGMAILLFVVPLLAQDPKSKGGSLKAPLPMGPLTGDKIKTGTYTGKLLSLPTADGDFTLEITSKVMELKPNAQDLVVATAKFQTDYQNGLQNIQTDLRNNPTQAQYHLNRLRDHQLWYQRHLPNYQAGGSHFPYQVKDVVQSVDFKAAGDVSVRLLDLPPEFDDAGKLKKRTQSELNKLKGKDRLAPGYEAKKEDLNTGALVKITLARKPLPKGEKATDSTMRHNHVTQIVIISKDGKAPEPMLKANPAKK